MRKTSALANDRYLRSEDLINKEEDRKEKTYILKRRTWLRKNTL